MKYLHGGFVFCETSGVMHLGQWIIQIWSDGFYDYGRIWSDGFNDYGRIWSDGLHGYGRILSDGI